MAQAPTIRSSGKAIADLQTLGLRDMLEALLATNEAATAAPTAAPTATATGGGSTGGLLTAGTYYLKFTEVNGLGETTASPESSLLTISATNIPQVTFPTLKTGNTARNLYLTPEAGASGTEVLYAANIATTTYSMAVAAPGGVAPPAVNTTGLTAAQATLVRAEFAKSPVLAMAFTLVSSYLDGSPISAAAANARLVDYATVFHLLQEFLDEVAALILANPGTIHTGVNGAGNAYTYRTIP